MNQDARPENEFRVTELKRTLKNLQIDHENACYDFKLANLRKGHLSRQMKFIEDELGLMGEGQQRSPGVDKQPTCDQEKYIGPTGMSTGEARG